MTKICKTCEREVEDQANFCPYCKGRSFRPKYEITEPNDDIIHKVFYWPYPGGATLSKTKISSIVVFLYFLVLSVAIGSPIWVSFIIALMFGVATLLIGFIVHRTLPQPPQDKVKHNDYGLIQDLKHLFFYWQDRHGGYILSKTKVISFAVFLVMFAIGLFIMSAPVILGALLCGFIFEVPAFLIGYGIHKLTFKDTSKHVIPEKKEKPKKIKKVKEIGQKKIIPEYMDYQMQLDDLNSKFKFRDKTTRDLIAKRFEPPQLTYTRFITGVDKSKEIFEKNMNSALTMISLADEYSPRIAGEIESKIDILKSILHKLDDLSNELVLNDDLSEEGDVDNMIQDMDDLIGSVRDYD